MLRVISLVLLALVFGSLVAGVVWQLPGTAGAMRAAAIAGEAPVDEAARIALARGEFPDRLPSQDFMLAQIKSAFILDAPTRGRLAGLLLPWRAIVELTSSARGEPATPWPVVLRTFAMTAGVFAMLHLWTLVVCAGCTVAAAPGFALLTTRRHRHWFRLSLDAAIITAVAGFVVAYRQYNRSQFFAEAMPSGDALAMLVLGTTLLAATAGLMRGRHLGLLRRRRTGLCVRCGYALLPGRHARCAECGLTTSESRWFAAQTRKRCSLVRNAVVAVTLLFALWPMLAVLLTHAPTPGFPSRSSYITRWLTLRITNDTAFPGLPQVLVGEVGLPPPAQKGQP